MSIPAMILQPQRHQYCLLRLLKPDLEQRGASGCEPIRKPRVMWFSCFRQVNAGNLDFNRIMMEMV